MPNRRDLCDGEKEIQDFQAAPGMATIIPDDGGSIKKRVLQCQALHKTTTEVGEKRKKPWPRMQACLVPRGASFGADKALGFVSIPGSHVAPTVRDLHERPWKEEGNASRQSPRGGLKGGESHSS